MATLLLFHAHPDDEAIATAGTMAKAAAAGHRVVLVTATRGEEGEVPDGFLDPGEELWQRRERELAEACKVLGVVRQEFLGYRDSGMVGTPENDNPDCFWRADVEAAAARLADLLREERVDVLTVYDDHGNYGHPDHVQVHRVGVRAAALAGVPKVYEATLDRDRLTELWRRRDEFGLDLPDMPDLDEAARAEWGMPSSAITTRVDVGAYLGHKREAMAAHASQIAETSFFLAMPPEAFAAVWGIESYVLRGAAPGTAEADLFEGIA